MQVKKKYAQLISFIKIFNKYNDADSLVEISDNKQGSDYLKQIAKEVGFDLSLYKERRKKPIRYCNERNQRIWIG